MKFENTKVWGFEHAIRGMRNPKNSWHKGDSRFGMCTVDNIDNTINADVLQKGAYALYAGIPAYITNISGNEAVVEYVSIGKEDMMLAQKLIKSGSEHRKFMRQIFVSVDITAPLYWWKEFDTYKVGTVANSTSTMHKIHDKEFTIDDFSCEHLQSTSKRLLLTTIEMLNDWRDQYLVDSNNRKTYWWQMIQLLPSSYNQKRTVTMNYENLFAMCSNGQRRGHKLNEWSGKDDPSLPNFIAWARTLPYAQEFIFIDLV